MWIYEIISDRGMDLQFNELDCYRLLIVKLVKHLAISKPDNSCYELSPDPLRLYSTMRDLKG